VPRLAVVLIALVGVLAAVLSGCSAGSALSRAAGASAPSGTGSSGGSGSCPAPSSNTPGAATSHLKLQSLCALPPEAGQVWHTIETGGRFTYPRDGIVFNNAERVLPSEQRGYYHEYTVPTPGAKTRGARRLITGSARELYYTGDHYASFVVVDPTATSTN
jgi:guanyl-specific ribonuclease Sa